MNFVWLQNVNALVMQSGWIGDPRSERKANQAGVYRFVVPNLSSEVWWKRFERYALPCIPGPGHTATAFVVAEVHPFSDGKRPYGAARDELHERAL